MSRENIIKQIEELSDFFYHQAMARTGGNEEKAKELRQETLLKMLLHADKYVDISLKAWGSTIQKNIFLNDIEKIIRRQTVFFEDYEEVAYSFYDESDSGNPELAFDKQLIKNKINTLEDNYKTALHLRDIGYSYEEISKKTEVPLNTVKTRIHKGKTLIKEYFTEHHTPIILAAIMNWLFP